MLKALIKSADIQSLEPKLRIKGEVKYKTLTGGVVGIVSMIIISILSIYFLMLMFNRRQLSIIYNQNSSKFPQISFDKTPFMFNIFTSSAFPLKDQERIFSFDMYLYSASRVMLPDGSYSTNATYRKINYEKCNKTKHFGDYGDLFSQTVHIDTAFCITPNQNITLSGIYGEIQRGFSFLLIYPKKCINTTSYNKCLDSEIIDKNLQSVFFVYDILDYDIDHQNSTNPATLQVISKAIPISTTIYKRAFLYMKNVIYKTDYGYVFDNDVSENFHQFYDGAESYDNRKEYTFPGAFSQIQILVSPKEDVYYRGYLKFQTVLANIGGIIKGILITANLLVSYLSNKQMNIDLINAIFDTELLLLDKITEENLSIPHIPLNPKDKIKNISQNEYIKNALPLFNLNLVKNNSKSINENNKFQFNFRELLCSKFFNINKKNLDIYERCISVIKEKSSIEYSVKKFCELEGLKKILLDENQLFVFNLKMNEIDLNFLEFNQKNWSISEKFSKCKFVVDNKLNDINNRILNLIGSKKIHM